MNEQVINGLWSASNALANHVPLNKEEQHAVAILLQKTAGIFYPTQQEHKNYQQDIEVVKRYENEPKYRDTLEYFEARKNHFEQKYEVI